MEDVKAVTAPMEVVPMRHHEAIQVKDFVKTEKEDVGSNEAVAVKEDQEDLYWDTPDLLSEIGDGDLVDYIVSEVRPLPFYHCTRSSTTQFDGLCM